ncbi:MAG: hypothetical protein V7636_638 [Actinomycetota bacterium]|jgi:anti-anti-sigma factor
MTTTPVPAEGDALVIDVVEEEDRICAAVRGDIDIDGADIFDAAVERALLRNLPIVIDLSDATFLGSRGIAAIVRARRLLGDGLGPITVVVTRDVQRRALEVTGVDRLVHIEPTSQGAT